MRYKTKACCYLSSLLLALSMLATAETITIGAVNNGDMLRMQALSNEFEKAYPDIDLEWVILDETKLRQSITKDIASGRGKFDVITIGMYEAPIWGKVQWLEPMDDLPQSYQVEDLFDSVRAGLSAEGTLYALPFYGESSMTMYRKDLFEKAGLTMPAEPTWSFMRQAAAKIHDPDNGVYGACLRGQAGWGNNMALISTLVNAFGGRWFDENWQPQFDSPEWRKALNFYVDLLTNYGPPESFNNGFNENLKLMNAGQCGFWVDATAAGSFVVDPKQSQVADQIGFVAAPAEVTAKGTGWLWSWALAVPASSKHKQAAQAFTVWATSQDYAQLIAERYGTVSMPPGARQSTYANAEYMAAAPFAQITLEQMNKANPQDATLAPNPYTGIQFVAIPKFQAFAAKVARQVADVLKGETSLERALELSQKIVMRDMKRGGYIKSSEDCIAPNVIEQDGEETLASSQDLPVLEVLEEDLLPITVQPDLTGDSELADDLESP